MFEIHRNFDNKALPLALNIKSDGLQIKLKKLLLEYKVANYFVFDMSVPDGLQYLKNEINSFTRQSEYETLPSFYDDAKGVWLDEFNQHWINEEIIEKHLNKGKEVCIVSPDLHARKYKEEWRHYKEIEQSLNINNLMICTDHPEEAREFFDE